MYPQHLDCAFRNEIVADTIQAFRHIEGDAVAVEKGAHLPYALDGRGVDKQSCYNTVGPSVNWADDKLQQCHKEHVWKKKEKEGNDVKVFLFVVFIS
jgi:predicted Ser/Thr protein kinase